MDELARGTALTRLHSDPAWEERACAGPGVDPEMWHAPDGETARDRRVREAEAKRVCWSCPIRAACAAYAMDPADRWWEPHGVWGGTTPGERAQARRRAKTREVYQWERSWQRPAILTAVAPRVDLRGLKVRAAAADAGLLAQLEPAGIDRRCAAWQLSRMCTLLGLDGRKATVGQLVAAAQRARVMPAPAKPCTPLQRPRRSRRAQADQRALAAAA